MVEGLTVRPSSAIAAATGADKGKAAALQPKLPTVSRKNSSNSAVTKGFVSSSTSSTAQQRRRLLQQQGESGIANSSNLLPCPPFPDGRRWQFPRVPCRRRRQTVSSGKVRGAQQLTHFQRISGAGG